MGIKKLLLKNIDIENYTDINVYEKHNGYRSLRKVLKEYTPEQVKEEVKKSNIKGRGGAGFPTGVKWSFLPENVFPRYLVINADEGEPGTFKDRVILEKNPHLLIEGIIISSYAIKCNKAFIYIRGEYTKAYRILKECIEQAKRKNYLGKNILGSGFNLEIYLYRGAGAYICGEETALLNSLEGRRGHPRLKPPFPAVEGLYSKPTIVNNVETIATVPIIIELGGDEYNKLGTKDSSGTRLFSISGCVNKPGTYELELGTPLIELIEIAGGIKNNKNLKAVTPGGSSTPILTKEEAERVDLSFESMAEAKTMLGSGAVIIYDENVCMVKLAWRLAKFYSHESCGWCSPCREGTNWYEKILYRIENGKGFMDDLDVLKSLYDNIMFKTFCLLGEACAMPIQSILLKFEDEFIEHIKNKKCGFKV